MPQRPQTQFELPQSQFSLTPAARPYDTFVTPAASHSAPNSDLIGLANALKELEPALNQVVDNRYQGYKEQDIIAAQAFAEKNKFENMAAFKAAVKAGKIPESNTPWFLVQLKAENARDQAVKASAAMKDAYDQNPVQFEDGVDGVGKFADKSLSTVLEGADAWETAAMRPVLAQAKASLLNHHVSKRSEERAQEREITAKRDFTNALYSGLSRDDIAGVSSSDPAIRSAALAKVDLVRQQFKSMMSEKSKTVLGPKLEQWLVDSVASATVSMKAPGLGRAILEGMVGFDNKGTLDKSYGSVLDHADDRAHDELLQLERQQEHKDLRDTKLRNDQLKAQMFTKLEQLKKDNPNYTAADMRDALAIPYGDFAKDHPELAETYNHTLEWFVSQRKEDLGDKRQEAVKTLLREATIEAAQGPISQQQKVDLFTAFAMNDSPQSWHLYKEAVDSLNKPSPVKTGDDVLEKLYRAREDGSLTPSMVFKEYPNLSDEDKRRFSEEAMRPAEGTQHFAATVDNLLDRIQEVGMTQYTDSQGLEEETRVRVEEGLKVGMSAARNELRTRLYNIESMKVPQTEKDNLRNEAVDQTLKNWFNVPSYEKFHSDAITKRQKKIEEKANPAKPTPQPMDKEVFQTSDHPDKVFDGITRDQTSVARWALLDAKPKRMSGEPEVNGLYEWKGWANQKSMPTPVQTIAFNWGEDEGAVAEHAKPVSGTVLYSNQKVPDLQLHYAREEMKHRDEALRNIPDLQSRVDVALKGWKATTESILERQKAGNPFVTYAEKRQLADDTNTARTLTHYRKLFGYKPEELKELGPDAWKNYRLFMNSVDLEENGPKAIQKLGIKPADWQNFRTAQKTLIERDIHDAQY